MGKLSKDEKEAQYQAAIEQVLGFPLLDWQKPVILEIRSMSLAGKEIDMAEVLTSVRLSKQGKHQRPTFRPRG